MHVHVNSRLLVVCGLLLAGLSLMGSPASATTRVRGTSNYGVLSDHDGTAAPGIGGTGSSILSDTLYQCSDGTPCPVALTIPGTSLPCANVFSSTEMGNAPCFDLFLTINPGTTFNPGSTLWITLTNFSDSGEQFGLYTCGSGSDGVCTQTAPPGCSSALDAMASTGTSTVNIPFACLAAGDTFYFDETANNSVSAAYVPGTASAAEPGSFILVGVALASFVLFSKRLQSV